MKLNFSKATRLCAFALCASFFLFGSAATKNAEAGLCSRLYNLLHFNRCCHYQPVCQNVCPCTTLPYTPAYSYQPISHHSAANCGCSAASTAAWQPQSTPQFSMQGHFPATQSVLNTQPTGYPTSSISSGVPATSISYPRSVQTKQPTPTSQDGWTTIPARVKRTKLSGVINEIPEENLAQPQPYEKTVPTPQDLSYKPQMPHRYDFKTDDTSSVLPSNRIALGPQKRLSTAPQRTLNTPVGSKTFRRETRSYVRAPSAAIVWQTP